MSQETDHPATGVRRSLEDGIAEWRSYVRRRQAIHDVDVDELEDVTSEAGVSAMPSFYVYKDGKVVDQIVGASKEKLDYLLRKYSSSGQSSSAAAAAGGDSSCLCTVL